MSRVVLLSQVARCSIKKSVVKKFAIFTGKHLCWSLCLIKLQAYFIPILPFIEAAIGDIL